MTSNSSAPHVPPFIGFVETTVNALRLIHAARQGVIPRITRRLNDTERRTMIKSGAVFVFSVEESGIKRWTDGLLWSPSRIVGNFLVYREINERTSTRGNHKKGYPADTTSSRDMASHSPDQRSFGFNTVSPGSMSSNDQGTFKPNGLIKKTITVTVDGSDLHLISYYTSEDIRTGRLKKPTSRPDIMELNMPPHIFRLTNFRNPPKVEIAPDGKPRLVCEADDIDTTSFKVEEPTYKISESSDWSPSQIGPPSTSPVNNPFVGSSLYPVRNSTMIGSNDAYARERPGSRWPVPMENLRMPSSSRQHAEWSVSPSTRHSVSSSRNASFDAETSPTNSWSPLHSHPVSNHWPVETYETSHSSASGLYLDRSRVRSSSLYQPADRGDSDGAASPESSHHRYSAQGSLSRDTGSRASSWVLPEPVERDGGNRSPHSGSSFTSSSSSSIQHFSSHGYHSSIPNSYSSAAWSPTENNSVGSPFSPHPTLPSYHNTYASSSGAISSPEDYSNVDEYGEA